MKKYSRNGGEHALVNGKEEIRNELAGDRWSAEDIAEANVIERADELASIVAKGERIAPEEPLKRNNSRAHDRKP
jgi:hypothetical protein